MKIAFLGVGNMAGAILGSLHDVVPEENIILYDRFPAAVERFADRAYRIADSASAAVSAADCIIFAVKPQNLPELFAELNTTACDGKVIVTIAASVKMSAFTDALGNLPVIRVMPNTPMLIGAGVSALCRNQLVDDETFAFVRSLFDAAGQTLVLDEADMNKIISVTASSPAYVFLFIKSIYESGLAQGLADHDLLEAVCNTVIGSARLVKESGKTPDELIAMVTSKKGTTEQAMLKLHAQNFSETIHDAMLACTARAEELGRS